VFCHPVSRGTQVVCNRGVRLAAIVSGVAVVFGLLNARPLDTWTAVFLFLTAATSVTGFLFPFHGFTPAIGVGVFSVAVLAAAVLAGYVRRLAGSWRKVYVVAALLALYLNVFVLVVQAFQKVSALKELAPTQSEPPFLVAQLAVLVLFVFLALTALMRFRGQPARVSARAAGAGWYRAPWMSRKQRSSPVER
jgi:lysylphosphatidylglycerol synthetase-like protein (DUF2156 family)